MFNIFNDRAQRVITITYVYCKHSPKYYVYLLDTYMDLLLLLITYNLLAN